MKKIFWILVLAFILYFILGGCDNRSEKAKLAHNDMYKVIEILEKRYSLQYIGRAEGATKEFYNKIGLSFNIFRPLSKEEGTKMLVDATQILLNEINSDQKLKPFLINYPFTPNNVEMTIYVYQPNGQLVYYPDILIFSARRGKITYDTKIPEQPLRYYTQEEESYQDALNTIKSEGM